MHNFHNLGRYDKLCHHRCTLHYSILAVLNRSGNVNSVPSRPVTLRREGEARNHEEWNPVQSKLQHIVLVT